LDITGRNLYSFGRGDYGQLGTSLDLPYAGYHESTPQPVFLDLQSANKEKNTVRANSTLISIACGDSHSMAVTENGELFTWGFNDVGLLGHGGVDDSYCPRKVEGIPKVLLADGGSQHTMILTERH
jgi:alpha-tubulin suppressor-like RCC1 family protein